MFRAILQKEIGKLVPKGTSFVVAPSEQAEHGDYFSNIAMVAAKEEKKIPRALAEELKIKLESSRVIKKYFERIEIAGPGFLNFYIRHSALLSAFSETALSKNSLILTAGRKRKRINIEFVSANPTGPLTMANGRGGFYGDVLANVLEAVGHTVTQEYYINDTGNQVKLLGESILAAEGKIPDKEEYYKGDYIKKLRGKTAARAAALLLTQIKSSLKRAGIRFDVWFSEVKNLHKKGELTKVLAFLEKKRLIEHRDGAVWLCDAVLIKSDGSPTYFLADVAYHYDKFLRRKFDIAIDMWGADHHGYIARMKKGIEALGVNPDRLHIIIMQLVRLMSGGKEVRMSKRAGSFVTLDELLDIVGVDAARWFFLERSLNTHMDFDLDLARERSKKNPVYYVQYAHARACSILRKASLEHDVHGKLDFLQLLQQPKEFALMKKLLQLPDVVEDTASDYQVQRLPKYAYELARAFTEFYETHYVLDRKTPELTRARLCVVLATQKVLQKTLSLMGIVAPKKM